MGVSGPVAAVILVAALLSQGSALLTAHRNAEALVEQARAEWARRHAAIQGHAHEVRNATWDGPNATLTIELSNTGVVTMDAARLDVLLDGARRTQDVAARTVEGVATDVWPPGRDLNLTVTAASEPQRIAVASPWGALAAWEGA